MWICRMIKNCNANQKGLYTKTKVYISRVYNTNGRLDTILNGSFWNFGLLKNSVIKPVSCGVVTMFSHKIKVLKPIAKCDYVSQFKNKIVNFNWRRSLYQI